MLQNYKTMERKKVEERFKLKKNEYSKILYSLYKDNEDVKEFIKNQIIELRKKGYKHSEIPQFVNISYGNVCSILREDKHTTEVNPRNEAKKNRYWKHIQYLFKEHKQRVIDLKCNTGEDYEILKLLDIENKIKILPPTEKDCCVRVKLGGVNV